MDKLFHILESQQFTVPWLEESFFPLVTEMKKKPREEARLILSDKEMVSFFYEASTRTRLSFEIAIRRLGGKVIFSTDHAKEFSSVSKGETIEDTIRILCGYEPDIIVLRTDKEGMAQRAAAFSTVPIINAGDGMGQHPTQALLDIYTIKEELGRIAGTSIAIAGDLNRGRTARSLTYLYAKYPDIKIYFVSPDAAKMREDIKDHLQEHNIWFKEVYDLREVAPLVDVIYNTRVQKERGALLTKYGPPSFCTVNQEVLGLMKKEAIVMHPLPRTEEITSEVDQDPRAAYFRQAKNGLYVRMALLKTILT
ncbi:MAG: aspartate carbamoyltransferase [Patescibacteria group bacterium]